MKMKVLSVEIPAETWKRAKAVKRLMRISTAQVVRMGMLRELEKLEAMQVKAETSSIVADKPRMSERHCEACGTVITECNDETRACIVCERMRCESCDCSENPACEDCR